jgi:CarD family transcriptional regulator
VKKFKIKAGDTVIYPQHGACIVQQIKRMKAFGTIREYLILKTVIHEMTLSVPTDMIDKVGVRPPVSRSELDDLVAVLAKADPRVPANWSRRFKNHQEKLKSGDVYQVAEVVRNLAVRDRQSALSAAEKTMYDRARINLVSEIAPALRVSTEKAEEFLDQALEKGVLQGAQPSPRPPRRSAPKALDKPDVALTLPSSLPRRRPTPKKASASTKPAVKKPEAKGPESKKPAAKKPAKPAALA